MFVVNSYFKMYERMQPKRANFPCGLISIICAWLKNINNLLSSVLLSVMGRSLPNCHYVLVSSHTQLEIQREFLVGISMFV